MAAARQKEMNDSMTVVATTTLVFGEIPGDVKARAFLYNCEEPMCEFRLTI